MVLGTGMLGSVGTGGREARNLGGSSAGHSGWGGTPQGEGTEQHKMGPLEGHGAGRLL